MEKKLTDEEIVKALECCISQDANCNDCAFLNSRKDCNNVYVYTLDLIQRQKAEIERQNKDYIELDLECRELRTKVDELTEQLKDLNWYKMWHSKFKKEIEDLTLELETYRPTKLSGNGQCKCSKCGVVSWTDWFSRYKGQTLCNDCLKKNYGV